jgi:acetyl-CoA/propionyl-CoA carboxylase, biotin carboxylase, biotin carboxyl carrier protein
VFEKVLIANRGEISIRVARTLKEMGIGSVAVYSEIERDAPHVRHADEAFLLGPATPAESYLNVEKILQVARDADAEAIHPGYGFLAENAPFAAAVEKAKLTWIGPPPKAIEAMGSKTEARQIMQKAGVPIVPGDTEPVKDVAAAKEKANEIGYPIAVKAAGGGGGKGFRVAMEESELEEAFEGAAREGERFFSDPTVYLERYLEDPRHVEVQVLADSKGNVIHLGERDCSIQRRHQKLIEESPGPKVDEEMRERIGKIATDAAAAVGYRSAGTVEGLQVGDDYFFLEMNTRVQVEHCVTEMVTGYDIVREQVRIAAGEKLSITQDEVELRGHAIECRINAEAAHKNFAPAPGRITTYREPAGPGVRVDSGVEAGAEVTPMYDPMFAKLIVWDLDREKATARMLRALGEYEIGGITTLVPFHQALLATKQWAGGETCRDLTEDPDWLKSLAPETARAPGGGEAAEDGKTERSYQVEVGGKLFDVKVIGEAAPAAAAANPGPGLRKPPRRERGGGGAATSGGSEVLTAPLQGTILRVAVEQGAEVSEGDLICVIEAMKMENEITAHRAGKVTELPISDGASVNTGDLLAKIE